MRTRKAVLAVIALGVFVFGGAPVLAQDGAAQPERWWLDRAEEIEQFMRDAEVLDIEEIGEGVTESQARRARTGGTGSAHHLQAYPARHSQRVL